MKVFIDNILIYLRSKEEHEAHLRIALHTLWDHCLYAKLSKDEFWMSEVVFLGHVVSTDGIMVDPAKVKVVSRWHDVPQPQRYGGFSIWTDTTRDSYKISLPWQPFSHS